MNFLEFKTFRTLLEFYRKKQQGFMRKFFYKVVFLVMRSNVTLDLLFYDFFYNFIQILKVHIH
jgi:hypothetical protein